MEGSSDLAYSIAENQLGGRARLAASLSFRRLRTGYAGRRYGHPGQVVDRTTFLGQWER